MKKYRISKFYLGVYVAAIPFGLFAFISGIRWLMQDHDYNLLPLMLLTVGVMGTFLPLYEMIFDFQGGQFYLNAQSICMHIGLKKWMHNWADISDCGVIDTWVGDGRTFWVYFSTRKLTREEKQRFLLETRRDLANIAFFQYNKKIMDEIIPIIPTNISEILKECDRQIKGQLSETEKLYHR